MVENAPNAGIMLGWGRYLRDVAATGNVVRKADIGIAVSVAPGAGTALIANNMIADVTPRRHRRHGRRKRSSPAISTKAAASATRNHDQRQPRALSGDRLKARDESPRAANSPALRRAFASASSGLGKRLGHPQRAELDAVPVAQCRLREQRERVPLGVGEREQARDQRRRDGLLAARPAPSSHLMEMPRPSVGNAPHATPSAPVLRKMRSPRSRTISVPKRPVPATYQGWCVQAARSRAAARARSDEMPSNTYWRPKQG